MSSKKAHVLNASFLRVISGRSSFYDLCTVKQLKGKQRNYVQQKADVEELHISWKDYEEHSNF